MRYTNVYNLPQPVADAISRDTYIRGDNNYSVTELIEAPRIVQLKRRHWDELEEDVIDNVWSIFGSAVHNIMEAHASDEHFVEQRYYVERHGRKVGGMIDAYNSGTITDYKVTSAWSIIYGSKKDHWTQQLNCYDKDTEVLTAGGWKFFKDVSLEDQIFSYDPQTKQGYFQKPIAKQAYPIKGIMHHYKNNQVDLLVTPEHNMYVGNCYNKSYELKQSKNVITKRFKIKKTCEAGIVGSSPDVFTFKGVPHRIKKYNIDKIINYSDYVEFMAWYLAEGWVYKSKIGAKTIGISQSISANPEKYNQIKELLTKMGLRFHCRPMGFVFCEPRIFDYLKQFGGSRDKYIPQEILNSASSNDLNKFILTYALGDGSKNGSGWQIITSSSKMKDNLQECAIKAGWGSNILNSNQYQPNTSIYIVSIFPTIDVDVITGRQDVYYDDFVYDVSLPQDHILMVRRNGKACWSGNCYAHIMRENGIAVDRLQIVAFLRDWDKNKAKADSTYPQIPLLVVPIEVWEPEVAEAFLIHRLQWHILNEDLPDEALTFCKPEECWEQPTKYALYKGDNKRALRVFDDDADLHTYLEDNALLASHETEPNKDVLKKGYRIEVRKGKRTRCSEYCSLATHCNQWRAYQDEQTQGE